VPPLGDGGRRERWTRCYSARPGLATGRRYGFCLFDGGARLAGFAPYVQGMLKFGYNRALAPWLGLSPPRLRDVSGHT
jgi:hypothetical protein